MKEKAIFKQSDNTGVECLICGNRQLLVLMSDKTGVIKILKCAVCQSLVDFSVDKNWANVLH